MGSIRSEEHTSELQSPCNLVCRLLLEKKKKKYKKKSTIRHMYTVSTRVGMYARQPTNRTNCTVPKPQTPLYLFPIYLFFFFFNDTAPTEIYPLSLPDALPIYVGKQKVLTPPFCPSLSGQLRNFEGVQDRKSTRLNLQSPCNLVCRLLLEK